MPDLERIYDVAKAEELLQQSAEAPVLFFKHSLTCSISQAAFRELQQFLASQGEGDTRYALIEIQKAREVSNHLASATGVKHESPQAILVKDGQPVWYANHWAIDRAGLSQAIHGAS